MRTSVFVIVSAALGLAGCDLGGDDGGGSSTTDPTQDNIGQYEALRLKLEQQRELVLPAGQVDDVRAAGPYLVWLDIYQGFSGVLHIRAYPGGEEVTTPVAIGDEQTPPNYEISASLGMTARTVGGDALYTTFRLDTGAVVDEVMMAKPAAAKYDAYGLFGEQAYIVVEGEGLAVYEWTPGAGTPESVGTLAGADLGAFAGFVVAQDQAGARRLVAVGTQGTYSFDLATGELTQVPLPVMVLEGAINEYGVAALDGRDLWWYGWGDTEARAIHEELAASSYLLNPTYAQAHLPGSGFASQDIAIAGTTLYYSSNSGIYAYDVVSKTVTPVLLDDVGYADAGLTVKYTGLAAGDTALFTLGLESMSGSTGADGPLYRVAL